MASRAILVMLTVFWITMNVLLWRSEYGARAAAPGGAIPIQVVWKKILTAPDSSSLVILQHGQRIGFCQWFTRVGEGLAQLKEEDTIPEGMVERETGYRLAVEGNVAANALPQRAKFEASLKLGPRRGWQEVTAKLSVRPMSWEIHSIASERTVRLRGDDGTAQFDRLIRFAELENPDALLQELIGPWAPAMLRGFGWPGRTTEAATISFQPKWEAREDALKLGHSLLKAYRLRARLLDRYEIIIFVSRVGEILRVELPDELVLVNDQLSNL